MSKRLHAAGFAIVRSSPPLAGGGLQAASRSSSEMLPEESYGMRKEAREDKATRLHTPTDTHSLRIYICAELRQTGRREKSQLGYVYLYRYERCYLLAICALRVVGASGADVIPFHSKVLSE